MGEWIDVKDKLPKFNKSVLVCYIDKHKRKSIDKGYLECIDSRGHQFRFGKSVSVTHTYDATHWMPLPEPPK